MSSTDKESEILEQNPEIRAKQCKDCISPTLICEECMIDSQVEEYVNTQIVKTIVRSFNSDRAFK